MIKKSLNTLGDHAPKSEWLINFFDQGNAFFESNALGSVQLPFFTRFLTNAGLVERKRVTPFFHFIKQLGWENAEAWSYILVRLCYSNAQFRWYIQNLPVGSEMIDRKRIELRLFEAGVSHKDACSIIKAFGRIVNETPLGTRLHFGEVLMKGVSIIAIRRLRTVNTSPIPVLYSLYHYMEAENLHQTTLESLMDFSIAKKGMSRAQIFGMTGEELEKVVRYMLQNYSNYIYSNSPQNPISIILNRESFTANDILALR